MTINIAVLVSGRGSNLQSIIDNIESGYIKNAQVAVVISDVGEAYALERARNHGITDVFIDPSDYSDRQEYEKEMLEVLKDNDVNLLLLAGYMRLIGKDLISAYRNRIINIHPALLPSFKGLHAQQQAFDYGVKVSGCTVHFVDEGMDTGPIIIQKCVPVLDTDTAEELAARILEQEHNIFPESVKLFVEGKLKVEGRIVVHT
ncbi:phosphoribosylglycinamide formyltransferase [Methanolobus sp.]|jgi:phosphoribosylglycinamide formyltransferase-1|uniref:phosphoribosylglycinamide formyltransferase n=1 Tax=Methanolobus sp. TaxID=1874737 RepID=UPI002600F95C|nr:phosphoribosylglycinamide formyltransferase [Methanolobus sp.]